MSRAGLAARAFGPAAPWLAAVLGPHRRRLAALVALGLLAAGVALVPPWLTQQVIDRGLMARDPAALAAWSLALLAAGALALALGALTSLLHMRASVAMLADLRARLVRAILARPPSWRAGRQTGELMSRLDGDAGEAQRFAFNALLTGTGATARLAGGAAMLFALEWRLALVAVVIAPVELAFTAWARPRTEAHARETRERRGQLAAGFAEAVHNPAGLQAARAEATVAARLAERQRALDTALIAAHGWGEITRAAPQLIVALGRGAVFLAGGLMVIDGTMTLGALIAFVGYLGFLIGPTQSLLGLWHAQAAARAALDRLDEIMAAPLPAPARRRGLPEGPGTLRFEGLQAVPGGPVLDGTVPGGALARLAGPSGAGKSRLLAVLAGAEAPAAGRVLIDGADAATLDPADLHAAVLLVPQRPFVIRGTAADTLLLTAPDASRAAMAEALALVGLSARLDPAGGPDAVLGEDGLTLSGGERQRLCVARALLAPWRVLVLDEALSEVDPPAARAVMAAIAARRPGATRLVVAHGGAEALGAFDVTLAPRSGQAAA